MAASPVSRRSAILAGDGIHYEPRWFKPWPLGRRTQIEIEGHDYPLGDIYFDCGGMRIGFEICEDAWVANRPGAELSQHGIDIILNPSASHFAFGKMAVRERFVLEGSRAFGVHYVYANLVGNEAGRAIYDGGAHDRLGWKTGGDRTTFFVRQLGCNFRAGRYRCHAAQPSALREFYARIASARAELRSRAI